MPFLFAVDVRYDLPWSRTAFGARAEEVNRKRTAKAPRRASSRVVSRGAITGGDPVGTSGDQADKLGGVG